MFCVNQVLARVQEVAHSKVIALLVALCSGPEGPLAAIDLNSPPPPADEKKKKGKSVKAKKKVGCIYQVCHPLLRMHCAITKQLYMLQNMLRAGHHANSLLCPCCNPEVHSNFTRPDVFC